MSAPDAESGALTKYSVAAGVTSPPTDVALKLNGQSIRMSRDSTGAWSGKAELDLPISVGVEFRATGIAAARWTLEIKFTLAAQPDSDPVKDFKQNGKIPDNLLSIFSGTVNLTPKAQS